MAVALGVTVSAPVVIGGGIIGGGLYYASKQIPVVQKGIEAAKNWVASRDATQAVAGADFTKHAFAAVNRADAWVEHAKEQVKARAGEAVTAVKSLAGSSPDRLGAVNADGGKRQ